MSPAAACPSPTLSTVVLEAHLAETASSALLDGAHLQRRVRARTVAQDVPLGRFVFRAAAIASAIRHLVAPLVERVPLARFVSATECARGLATPRLAERPAASVHLAPSALAGPACRQSRPQIAAPTAQTALRTSSVLPDVASRSKALRAAALVSHAELVSSASTARASASPRRPTVATLERLARPASNASTELARP